VPTSIPNTMVATDGKMINNPDREKANPSR
jgi:hypothetical protein